MSTNEEYSHDATVAAVTSLLTYVSELYGAGYELSYPPPGGWECFNRDKLRLLQEHGKYNNGLTDRALELMRHMPYFLNDDPELMYFTQPAYHYQAFCRPDLKPPESELEKKNAEENKIVSRETYDQHLPPQFVVLTYAQPWKGYTIIVDTEQGCVRFWDRYDGTASVTKERGDLGYEYDEDEVEESGPEGWKLADRYRIPTFFDLWRREFLRIANAAQEWNRELENKED
ncbi:hypothetical protein PG999_003151 [Apiospora kogelbergensis]|uniref:SUKH-4 immunity protein n=1 Tax=Apiospora kogelbergensis TaxID=1337665 RepID=A0AAW0RAK2_9PEZI